MKNNKKKVISLLMVGILLSVVTGCGVLRSTMSEPSFSFAVMADPRAGGETWQNALSEIRDMKVSPDPAFARAELVLVAGDIDPLPLRYKEYQHVFSGSANRPCLLPMVGNHDIEKKDRDFRCMQSTVIPEIPGAVRTHPESCDYYVDHKNTRFIIVDAYNDFGKRGVINDRGREWVEDAIKSAPSAIDHIFVGFHEPAFPRGRHVGDSFDADPDQRNAFWRMLLKYRDRVRAVLVGHTHYYYRMRVLDPDGKAANDKNAYPDEKGGIYQVDAGTAGNGGTCTIVQVQVKGKDLLFRTLQASAGPDKPFEKTDEWTFTPGR